MSLELSLSIIALVIALASAWYARTTSMQAARANEIALHPHKLAVLEALGDFRSELLLCGENFSLAGFNRVVLAADNAKLYFPAALALEIESFAKAAHELNIRRDNVRRREGVNLSVPLDKANAVFAQLDACKALAADLVPKLEAQVRLVE